MLLRKMLLVVYEEMLCHKKEVASLWKMMCDVRADGVTQRKLVWLNDTSFRSLCALGNVCSKSTKGDFDSDQSMHFFIMTLIA